MNDCDSGSWFLVGEISRPRRPFGLLATTTRRIAKGGRAHAHSNSGWHTPAMNVGIPHGTQEVRGSNPRSSTAGQKYCVGWLARSVAALGSAMGSAGRRIAYLAGLCIRLTAGHAPGGQDAHASACKMSLARRRDRPLAQLAAHLGPPAPQQIRYPHRSRGERPGPPLVDRSPRQRRQFRLPARNRRRFIPECLVAAKRAARQRGESFPSLAACGFPAIPGTAVKTALIVTGSMPGPSCQYGWQTRSGCGPGVTARLPKSAASASDLGHSPDVPAACAACGSEAR